MDSWEFGRTVRRWRDRVRPEAVGVSVGGRRRATGLRREELAGLAGISVDYLTRLEQGRATSPSVQVVEALARALRVSDAERDLIFRLAGHATPGHDVVSSPITPTVHVPRRSAVEAADPRPRRAEPALRQALGIGRSRTAPGRRAPQGHRSPR